MKIKVAQLTNYLLLILVSFASFAEAQSEPQEATVEVHARLVLSVQYPGVRLPPAVIWLKPLPGTMKQVFTPRVRYTLLQQNRMFSPHLLVIPVGSVVRFPNADPFFHNVFSLFNGKRFDLGLYEAGSAKDVDFSREGVSYIFCNIHPEMAAVVLALSTPYYGVATAAGAVAIHNVPPGSYRMHVWSEAAQSADPVDAGRIVQVGAAPVHLGEIALRGAANPMEHHKNKFGEDYPPAHDTPY
jgi:hypothetical protein